MAGWGRCRNCGNRIWWGTNPYDSSRAFPYDDAEGEQSHFETCPSVERVTDEDGRTHRTSKCRACGARVWWETTPSGKRRPMDVDGTTATWECHFDTCAGEPVGAGSRGRAREQTREQTGWDPPRAHGFDMYSIRLWLPDLELTWPCTVADVTSAFRRLAMIHHPDMGGKAADFIRIKLAYDRLKELIPAEPVSV